MKTISRVLRVAGFKHDPVAGLGHPRSSSQESLVVSETCPGLELSPSA